MRHWRLRHLLGFPKLQARAGKGQLAAHDAWAGGTRSSRRSARQSARSRWHSRRGRGAAFNSGQAAKRPGGAQPSRAPRPAGGQARGGAGPRGQVAAPETRCRRLVRPGWTKRSRSGEGQGCGGDRAPGEGSTGAGRGQAGRAPSTPSPLSRVLLTAGRQRPASFVTRLGPTGSWSQLLLRRRRRARADPRWQRASRTHSARPAARSAALGPAGAAPRITCKEPERRPHLPPGSGNSGGCRCPPRAGQREGPRAAPPHEPRAARSSPRAPLSHSLSRLGPPPPRAHWLLLPPLSRGRWSLLSPLVDTAMTSGQEALAGRRRRCWATRTQPARRVWSCGRGTRLGRAGRGGRRGCRVSWLPSGRGADSRPALRWRRARRRDCGVSAGKGAVSEQPEL